MDIFIFLRNHSCTFAFLFFLYMTLFSIISYSHDALHQTYKALSFGTFNSERSGMIDEEDGNNIGLSYFEIFQNMGDQYNYFLIRIS